jgi:hypothetical protein
MSQKRHFGGYIILGFFLKFPAVLIYKHFLRDFEQEKKNKIMFPSTQNVG